MSLFKIDQKYSFKTIFLASLLGIYIHILLDSSMHWDIKPFYPLEVNPFLSRSILADLEIYMFCIWSFIGAGIIYALRVFLSWKKFTREKNACMA
ncbi:MAG: hypothetical protein QXX08_05105 [Candidatus Bathyarchaeia archaeon]